MQQEKLKAYAKINLGLDVIGRLPDGYHQVKMVMQTVGIYDELTFERAEQGIQITTDSGILPTDENNLIYNQTLINYSLCQVFNSSFFFITFSSKVEI